MKKVMLAVGGTGGHVFPAQVLAEELKQKGVTSVLAGHGLKKNPFLQNRVLDVHNITSAPLRGKNPLHLLKTFFFYCKGFVEALRLIHQVKPHLIIGFGSYYSFPVLAAAFIKKIPYILYESNAILGRINRLFAKRSLFCAYQLFDLEKKNKGRFIKVRPLLHHYPTKDQNRAYARKYFGLCPHKWTILVFGGSQGAVSLNHFVLDVFKQLSSSLSFQVIHLLGQNMDALEVKTIYDNFQIVACVKNFEANMPLAYEASDLMIARSGSLSICEQISFEIPAIYIPLPWSTDEHQRKNALFMQDKLKAACIVNQSKVYKDPFKEKLLSLMNNPTYAEKMRQSLKQFKEDQKDPSLSQIIQEYLSLEGK